MPGRVWRRTFTQWAILNTQVILRSSDLLIFKSPLSLSGRLITFAVVPKTPYIGHLDPWGQEDPAAAGDGGNAAVLSCWRRRG